MKRYAWIVFTRCQPGTDAEFNRWYDEEHLADVLAVPGMIGARRSRLADVQMIDEGDGFALVATADSGLEYPYLAIYSLEADDPATVLGEIAARSRTPRMPISPTLAAAKTMLFAVPDSPGPHAGGTSA